jgi:O-antigen/teichoic acid export membrane protein
VIVLGWRIEGVLWAGVIASSVTFLLLSGDVLTALRERFDVKLAVEMMRFGLPTVPSNLSSIIVQVADRPIMLMLLGNAAVGMYQTNFRLAIPMMLVVTVFEYAWKPFYLNHRDEPGAKELFARVLTLFTVGCGIVFLGTALWMPFVVQMPFIGGRFINPAYWSGLSIVPIILFAYFFNGVFTNLAAGFHITKRTGYFPLATGIAAVIDIGGTYLLVPSMGIEGAAWAKVLAYAASVVAIAIPLARIYPIRYDVVRVATAVAVAAGIYLAVQLLPAETTTQIVARMVAVPLYVVLLIALRVIGTATLRTLVPSRFVAR